MTKLYFKLTCDDTLENTTIALLRLACYGQADTGFSSFITLKLREQQLCIHNTSQQLLKADYYCIFQLIVPETSVHHLGFNHPIRLTRTASTLSPGLPFKFWPGHPAVGLPVPELFFSFPGLTSDLTGSLLDNGWAVDGTCSGHQLA